MMVFFKLMFQHKRGGKHSSSSNQPPFHTTLQRAAIAVRSNYRYAMQKEFIYHPAHPVEVQVWPALQRSLSALTQPALALQTS